METCCGIITPASQIQIIMKCLWLTVSGTGFLPAAWLFISNMKPDLLNVDSVAFIEEGDRLLNLTPPPVFYQSVSKIWAHCNSVAVRMGENTFNGYSRVMRQRFITDCPFG